MASPSKTELALQALVAALTAQANGPGGIPVPSRNETLPERFAPANSGDVNVFFNVNDGDARVTEIALGNPDEVADVYQLEHRAEVEWVVEAIDSSAPSLAAKEQAFDDGLTAIDDALKADRSLGGTVDRAEIDEIQRSNLVTDALPNVKAARVLVKLEFVSSRPF